jgi:hypothetical protein
MQLWAILRAMTIHIFSKMSGRNRGLLLWMLAVSLLLGVFEDVFGRQGYSGDAICYLNIVRAIHAGDWKLALSSYWGFGYPLLLSAVTLMFPANPAGEWIAVHVVNLVIFAATFFSFFWLISVAANSAELKRIVEGERSMRLLLVGALAIFLSIELSLDNVSRVGPDMLVSCLLFATTGLILQLREEPKSSRAIALGVLLGIGYVVKAIFLPLTLLFAFVALLAMWKKNGKIQCLALILIFAGIFAVPYIAGMSWAQGHRTYGDSGPLNYVWNVDKLEPGGLWQGQPPQFGIPLHPAKMVSEMPHVYVFDGPFPVTFGPFFNPPYYYAGVKRFFSVKAQIHAIGGNVLRLLKMLRLQIVLFALLVCWLLSRTKDNGTLQRHKAIWSLWPVLLLSISGIVVYLLVILESRYIAAFIAMLLLVLLFALIAETASPQQGTSGLRARSALAWILIAGCALNLLANEKDSVRDVLGNAVHHRLFCNQDQWIVGQYLQQAGLQPGDKVAIVSDLVGATLSTWAYMDRLQIVGILGGSLLETQHIDYDAFWSSSPEAQRILLQNFQDAGARVVVSISEPRGPGAQEWQLVPETKFWVYRF